MPFTVTYAPRSQNELAQGWLATFDRAAFSRAANIIDQILRDSPTTRGVDQGGYWTLTVDPLTVAFTVSPDDCLVTVRRVFVTG